MIAETPTRVEENALIVFELDGTLAPSKSAIDSEMGSLLSALLRVVEVAVISGRHLTQFQEQILAHPAFRLRMWFMSAMPGDAK